MGQWKQATPLHTVTTKVQWFNYGVYHTGQNTYNAKAAQRCVPGVSTMM
jgi:hypothetical protein